MKTYDSLNLHPVLEKRALIQRWRWSWDACVSSLLIQFGTRPRWGWTGSHPAFWVVKRAQSMKQQWNLAAAVFPEIRESPAALRFSPTPFSPCKSCQCLLMSDTWISCLTWPSVTPAAGREVSAPLPLFSLCECLIFGAYYLSDQFWGNSSDGLKHPQSWNN